MLSQEQNDLITRIGPGTPAGGLMRRYWQPVALVDELQGTNRPVKPVKLMGESLVLFRDDKGRHGLIERACMYAIMMWQVFTGIMLLTRPRRDDGAAPRAEGVR